LADRLNLIGREVLAPADHAVVGKNTLMNNVLPELWIAERSAVPQIRVQATRYTRISVAEAAAVLIMALARGNLFWLAGKRRGIQHRH
jgi:hypothetical protein